MEHIGYSLIDAQNAEVKFWGDTKGQSMGIPNPARLPDGSDVHCPSVGATYRGYRLVERWLDEGGPSITFDGTKVVVLRVTPPAEIAEVARKASYVADTARQDLLDRLRTATASQIDTWVTNNVTDLASARTVLKTIIKIIALDARN